MVFVVFWLVILGTTAAFYLVLVLPRPFFQGMHFRIQHFFKPGKPRFSNGFNHACNLAVRLKNCVLPEVSLTQPNKHFIIALCKPYGIPEIASYITNLHYSPNLPPAADYFGHFNGDISQFLSFQRSSYWQFIWVSSLGPVWQNRRFRLPVCSNSTLSVRATSPPSLRVSNHASFFLKKSVKFFSTSRFPKLSARMVFSVSSRKSVLPSYLYNAVSFYLYLIKALTSLQRGTVSFSLS